MAPALSVELLHDMPIWLALNVWVAIVVLYISKAVYRSLISRGWSDGVAKYMGRKTIHILGGGMVAYLLPFTFLEPYLPFISSMILTAYIYYYRHFRGLMDWFQDPGNTYEAHFTITWGLAVLLGWLLGGTPWAGAVPALMMSWGDGVTGVVRGVRRGRRVKSWEGSIAMLAASLALGLIFGYVGLIAGAAATIVERWDAVDDNITVPLTSLVIILLGLRLAPWLARPLI